jgi:hypothetical protein
VHGRDVHVQICLRQYIADYQGYPGR